MRGSVSLFALAAALAAPSAAFAANCANIVAGLHAFAGPGEACTVPGGSFNPTPTSGVLPFSDPGYGFVTYGGGQIDTRGAVTITTTGANASAAFSTGASSTMTVTGGSTLTTSGSDAYGVQAASGGGVSLSGVSISTSGANGWGLYADGANSAIVGQNVSVTTTGGGFSDAVLADHGGSVSLGPDANGLVGQLRTFGDSADAVSALSGGSATLTGVTISTAGRGAGGLVVVAGGTITATNVSISTVGTSDPVTGFGATGAYNGPGLQGSVGGTMNLTNVTTSTTGAGTAGVLTGAGGVTTYSGGSVSTSGGGAVAFGVNGANSSAQATNVAISTSGANANAIAADQGGAFTMTGGSAQTAGNFYAVFVGDDAQVSLTSTALTATGANSGGVAELGARARFTGSNLTINVTNSVGGVGFGNNAFQTYAGGGTATLSNSTIAVAGQNGVGVRVGDGGSVTLNNVAVSTSGAGSPGVLVNSGASAAIAGGSISTTAAGSAGLIASGSNVVVTAAGSGANALSISTAGAFSNVVQANNGASVTLGSSTATTTLTSTATSGGYAVIFAGGAGTSVTATNVAANYAMFNGGNEVFADQSAAISYTGGSIASTGSFVVNGAAWNSATLTLNGTTITVGGDGGDGLWASNHGTVVGSNLTIRATGGIYTASNGQLIYSGGASNNAFGPTQTGGILRLSNSDIQATGFGVFTADGGVTTLTGNTIAVTGPGGNGVLSNPGGVTNVLGGSVSTSGENGRALWAVGAGAVVNAGPNGASPLAVSTTGQFSNAVQAEGGGVVTLGSAAVATTVTASGQYARVYHATGANSRIDAINVTATLDGGHYGGFGSSVDLGATLNLTNGSIASNLSFSPVLTAQNGGTATLNGTAITATGDGGFGLWATAGGRIDGTGLTILATGGIDESSGTSSGGAANNGYSSTSVGGTLNLGSSSIVATGRDSYGVYTADGGVTTLTGDRIRVDGDNGFGVNSGAGGQIAIHGGTVDTTGAGAIGLYASGQVGPAGASGGAAGRITTDLLNGVGLAVTTTGRLSHGVMADQGGGVSLTGRSVTTSGEGAIGLYAKGAGSVIAANNVAVTTSGANNANAVFAERGGLVTMSGGSAATSGQDSFVVGVVSGASARLTNVALTGTGTGGGGVAVNGSASTFAGVGLTIVTRGGFDSVDTAHGVYNGGFAPYVGGGTVTLTNTTIATEGAYAKGIVNADGGSLTMTDGSVTTSGATAYGVQARGAGTVQLTGVTIATTGAGAMGVNVEGAGVTLTGSGLNVTASGARDAFGVRAHALYNGDGSFATQGGSVTLTDSRLQTLGDYAAAVATTAGGSTTLSRGSISTSGLQADAVYGAGGSRTTLVNLTLDTAANASKGVNVNGGATRLDGSGLTISTRGTIDPATGFHAQGVYNGSAASPGAGTTGGGTVTLDRSAISTEGANAAGLDTANGGSTRFTGGAITTNGAASIGLLASDAGTQVTVAPDSDGGPTYITTNGARAHAVSATTGATVSLTGAQLATGGDGASGLTVTGPTTIVTATDVVIGATGGVDADSGFRANAIYNGPGVSATGGGSLTLTRVLAAAGGDGVFALITSAGGVTTAAGGQFVTVGADAHAIVAFDGGSIQLSGAFAATAGNGGAGLVVSGAGSQIRGDGVGVFTEGGVSDASGMSGVGLYNGPFGGATSGGVATLSNSSIVTLADRAHAVVTGAGGVTTLTRATLQTSGAAAFGVEARDGGAATLSESTITTGGAGAHGVHIGAGSSVALEGANTIGVTGEGAAGLYIEAGGSAASTGPLAVNAASAGLYLKGASGAKTSLTLNSGLSLTTSGADGAAVTLSGDNIALAATGGGTIRAAGKTIALLDGANQSASFTNFDIQSLSGDLIFVDPASSTVNFTGTTANAGTGNLANVTNNSQLDLNADASALTGVITLTPGSIANVTLNNGSSWLVTGNSTTTNLNVNNSSIGFSPDGGFKTLTTTNYVGNNALITFNAALSGAGAADQLVINGGTATGSTQVAIRATGTPTGSLKLPLIVTTNGGTIAPDAFTLSGPVTAGGYSYALQLQDGGEYLVSSQVLSPQQATGSLASLAESKQTQAVTTKIMGSILTGATEQINCSSCSSGFASFGSFALGVHGRWTLNKNVSLLAGISYDNFNGKGVSVNGALLGALGLRYDAVQLGKYRPFVEAGIAAEPYASVTYRRSYLSALGESVGVGTAISRSATVYGRMGYIWRLSQTDEAAAYTGLSRSWTWTSGYTESATPANPFGAVMAPALDRMNIWTAGAQVTHLFGQHIEGNLSAAYARAFGASYGSSATINGFGSASALAPTGFDWVELGGRVSYRFSKTFVADAFVLGTLGAEPAGKQIHGGVALRLAF